MRCDAARAARWRDDLRNALARPSPLGASLRRQFAPVRLRETEAKERAGIAGVSRYQNAWKIQNMSQWLSNVSPMMNKLHAAASSS